MSSLRTLAYVTSVDFLIWYIIFFCLIYIMVIMVKETVQGVIVNGKLIMFISVDKVKRGVEFRRLTLCLENLAISGERGVFTLVCSVDSNIRRIQREAGKFNLDFKV